MLPLLHTASTSPTSPVNEKFLRLSLSVLMQEPLDTSTALANCKEKVTTLGAEKDSVILVMHARFLAGMEMGRHYIELEGVGHND